MRHSISPHQLRQLRDIRCNPLRVVAGEQISGRAPARITLEIHVGERVPVLVADDEAGVVHLVDRPRRREAALAIALLNNNVWGLPEMVVRDSGIVRQKAPEGHCIAGRPIRIGHGSRLTHVIGNELSPLLRTEIVRFGQGLTFGFSPPATNRGKLF